MGIIVRAAEGGAPRLVPAPARPSRGAVLGHILVAEPERVVVVTAPRSLNEQTDDISKREKVSVKLGFRFGTIVTRRWYPGILDSLPVGTQNIDAITPSAVGPTTSGGPQEGTSSPSCPSTHWREAPNGSPGLIP